MKKKGLLSEFISFLLLILPYLPAWAQANEPQADIRVERDGSPAIELHMADLDKFRRIDVQAKDRDGVEHIFSGVALSDILKTVGGTFGPQLRGINMAQVLVAKSGDGYQVVFTLPELDSSFSDRTIILAYVMDGKPLPAGMGPFRIIVPGEKNQPDG